jgi:hypothetical protein
LHEIGCKAFVLILDKNNPKIYACSFECILISYSPESKVYRLYHCPLHKVVHVKFVERFNEGEVAPAILQADAKSKSILAGPARCHGAIFEEESDDEFSPSPIIGAIPILNTHPEIPGVASVPPARPATASPSCIPIPATDSLIPRRSNHVRVPSSKRAILEGILHIPSIAKAVAEAKESAIRVLEVCAVSWTLKAQRTSNCEERQLTTLKLRNSVPSPVPGSSAPVSPSEDTPVLLSKAFAASLAGDVISLSHPADPMTVADALTHSDVYSWHAAIRSELDSLASMGIYKLVPCSAVSSSRKILREKRVFRLKHDKNGLPVRHKAQLVVKDFKQVFRQDYLAHFQDGIYPATSAFGHS